MHVAHTEPAVTLNLPAAHCAHDDEPLAASVKEPGAHATHTEPALAKNVPALHGVHVDEPVRASVNEPNAHASQAAAAPPAAYVPATHAIHTVAASPLNLPAVQSTHADARASA
jgi:hypothetical protein